MSESLRDQLSAAFDKAEVSTDAPVDTAVDTVQDSTIGTEDAKPSAIGAVPDKALTEAVKPPSDDRPRGPDGKFIEKKDAPAPAKQAQPGAAPQSAQKPPTSQSTATAPAAPAPTKARPQRPSSWKKDFWQHWETLDPALAEYLHTRENQFASGVSAYKAEAEAAKPLMEAMAPFMPVLQQHGIQPGEWIGNLGRAHQTLAMGSPEQKAAMFMRLASEYRVPVESMFVQGQDGKIYWNQQLLQHAQQQPAQQQQRAPQQDPRATVREILEEERARAEVQSMESDSNNYPHFAEVRETMHGLLQAGLATDLKSAYTKALHLPEHSQLREADAAAQRAADEEKRRAEEAQRVAQAKAKTVSPRSSTPSAPQGGEKPKGLRSQLENSFEQVVGGRV